MSDRIVTAAMIILALAAALYLLLGGRAGTTTEEAMSGARRWTDSLGIRVTGIVCDRSVCTIAPENGVPFTAYCNASGCTLAGDKQ